MWGMLNQCSDMEVASLEVQVQLFGCLVSPLLGFCAEVWAPTLLREAERPHDCLDNPLQRVQNLFMRRLGGGLRKAPPDTSFCVSLAVGLWFVVGYRLLWFCRAAASCRALVACDRC
jgi:hypothetical protein